jgi:2-amino-4-hydroxy-6-hydroxymethyldihydropteridine diphosphokinase
MGTPALIGLGSNLGDRPAHLGLAVAALSATPGVTVRAVSSYYETAPVGGPPGQGRFLNAAAALETTLDPLALLDALNAVEDRAGRVRSARWGERTLDLDLLLFGDRVIETPRLQVPHPRMALRRFVLAPMAEVAPDAVDPVTGRSARALLANLDRRPSYVAFAAKPHWTAIHSRVTSRDDNPLYNALLRALAAAPIERRVKEVLAESAASVPSPGVDRPLDLRGFLCGSIEALIEFATRWLDPAFWSASDWGDRWLVSHFWFDALYLSLGTAKGVRPQFARLTERFLEARARVLPPTFVVARPSDCERLGLHAPQDPRPTPIGRDTPVLRVEDFASEAALDAVVSACSATRTG